MAIKNNITVEYLKVTGVYFNFLHNNYHIDYVIFANQDQRKRYDDGLSMYEKYQNGIYNGSGVIMQQLQSMCENNTLKEAILAGCYRALKNDMFAEWEDC